MKKFTSSILLCMAIGISGVMLNSQTLSKKAEQAIESVTVSPKTDIDEKESKSFDALQVKSLFDELKLENEVSYEAFCQAYSGYEKITDKKKEILTIIDFTKPSNKDRMYVIDMKDKKILYSTVVAHGKNSGEMYATSFSNISGSNKSSLGFYLTSETYQGGNGFSLRLDGLEKGFNDKARERAIVIHGASYANPSVAVNGRRLGRSLGCPALPQTLNKPIINTIKDGSVLYIYANNDDYNKKSELIDSVNS